MLTICNALSIHGKFIMLINNSGSQTLIIIIVSLMNSRGTTGQVSFGKKKSRWDIKLSDEGKRFFF